ncbi:MAG: hypothetical protein AAFR58_07480 [Cyanobacteria bacterium J06627_28]
MTGTASTSRYSPRQDEAEALSDHGVHHTAADSADLSPETNPEETLQETAPLLPNSYSPTLKPKGSKLSVLDLPKGKVTGQNAIGECLIWLLVWGTVGFFRAYIPASVLLAFDRLFSPWGMAVGTGLSALVIGQMLRSYGMKLGKLKSLATTAIEYGEAHHQADVQNNIYELLTEAEERTHNASAWLTSWLTALVSLFIIGAFY